MAGGFADHPIPEQPCPACGTELVGAADIFGHDGVPKAEVWVLCDHCAEILRFDAACRLHAATSKDLAELAQRDPHTYRQLNHLRELIRQFWAARN
jgi:hypothetical protein